MAKQKELIAAGYDIGKADGIWGKKSQAAWDEMNASVKEKSVETSFKEEQVPITPREQRPTGLTRQVPKTQWKQLPNGTWYKDTKAGQNATVESTGTDIGGRNLKYGGLVTGLRNTSGNLLMNKKGKRLMAQSGSLSATNELFLGNPLLTKRKKAVYVPGAAFQDGGSSGNEGGIEAELDEAEINDLVAQGYVVEEINEPIINTIEKEPETQQPEIISEYGWDYKKEGDQVLTRRTGNTDWIVPKGKALESIQKQVYKEVPQTNVNTSITPQKETTIKTSQTEKSEEVKNKEYAKTLADGYLPTVQLGQDEREEICSDKTGCAGNVSIKMTNIFGGLNSEIENFKANEDLWSKNAWFNRDYQESIGGKVIYSTEERGGPSKMKKVPKELYSKFQVGDYVHLDRSGSPYEGEPGDFKNEKLEHIGFIIGKDKDGVPLVWHGSDSGKAYIQRINESINLYGGDLTYEVASVVRNNKLNNIDHKTLEKTLGKQKYYRDIDSEIDKEQKLKISEHDKSVSSYQKDAVDIVNSSIRDFVKIDYPQDDVLYTAQLLIGGISERESSGADWSLIDGSTGLDFPIAGQLRRKGKEAAARILKNQMGVQKEFEDDEASRGVYQIKPNMNFPKGSKTEKDLKALGINKSNMFDSKANETKAAMIIMLNNYDQLKKDPRFDEESNMITLDGNNYPASYILAKAWSSGIGRPDLQQGWYDREKYKGYLKEYDIDYSNNAIGEGSRIRLQKDSNKDILKDRNFIVKSLYEKREPLSEEEQLIFEQASQDRADSSKAWFANRDSESTKVVNNNFFQAPLDFIKDKTYGTRQRTRSFDPLNDPFSNLYEGADQVIDTLPRFSSKQSSEDKEKLIKYRQEGYTIIPKDGKIYVTVKVLPGVEIRSSKQQGGIVLDLSEDEIRKYLEAGYVIEEL